MRRNDFGFTLVEVTITVLILGILAAVSLPRFAETTARYKLRAAAQRLEADLRLARRYAIARSQTQEVQFDLANRRYTLVGRNDADRRSRAYVGRLDEAPYDVDELTLSLGGATTIAFDVYGSASADGSITLRVDGFSQTLNITAATGAVTWP